MDIGTLVSILGFVVALCIAPFQIYSKLPERTIKIISTSIGVLAAALMAGGQFWLVPYYSHSKKISQIIYFEGEGGKTLLVFNDGGTYRHNACYRLSVLNAGTGELLGKEILDSKGLFTKDNTELVAITDDKVWLTDFHRRLHARDPYTGELVLTREQIAEKYPKLDPAKNARSAPAVEVKTDDGYVFAAQPPLFQLELKAFPEYRFKTTDTLFHSVPESKWTHGCRYIDDKKALCLFHDYKIDHDQKVMVLMSGHWTSSGAKMDERLNPTLKLRDPFFLEWSGLNDPKSVIIGHIEINKEYYEEFELTRFDLKGRVIWSIKPGTDLEPKVISKHNGMIYLTIEGRVLAFDAKTGKKNWEKQL